MCLSGRAAFRLLPLHVSLFLLGEEADEPSARTGSFIGVNILLRHCQNYTSAIILSPNSTNCLDMLVYFMSFVFPYCSSCRSTGCCHVQILVGNLIAVLFCLHFRKEHMIKFTMTIFYNDISPTVAK